MTISPVAGDGVGSPALRANIQLPDSGNTVGVQGIYYPGKKDHHKRVTTERPHPTGGSPPPGRTRKGEVDSDSLFRVFRWIPWLISDPSGAAIGCCWTDRRSRFPERSPALVSPGSGSNYWITELNTTTGVLSVKTSTSATPSPVAGNVTLFSQTLPSTAPTAISQQGNFFFPWLGTVSPN